MEQQIFKDSDHYSELINRQVDQYKSTEIMHDLPPIFEYWSAKYNSPKFKEVAGSENLIFFYAGFFQKCLAESKSNFLISVGSGDSSIEIAIVKTLVARGVKIFFLICLELSPLLIEKARKKIDEEKLGDIITAAQIDINSWKPNYSFAGVMAHHSLHHILDLEQLFSVIKNNLSSGGRFLTADIIGRNGHMRWPEALSLIRRIWKKIPRRYKFHHQFRKFDDYYDNWDCSAEGFEGIRSQDILPLLVKNFSFEVFYAYGNLIDAFIDRGFGPNFNPANPLDTGFIDYINDTNESLISNGILKPTMLIAVMCNEKVNSTKMYKNWTPEFCVRDPVALPPGYDSSLYLKDTFGFNENDNSSNLGQIAPYSVNSKLLFTSGIAEADSRLNGIPYLTYGWCNSELGYTWTSCEDAAVSFQMDLIQGKKLFLEISFLVYHSPLFPNTIVEIMANETPVISLKYENRTGELVSNQKARFPFTVISDSKTLEIKFILPNRRQPQYEEGADVRSIGIGLAAITISKI